MRRHEESIEERLSYREPLQIKEIHVRNNEMYALCPRCNRIFDTEFQPFCSECGQATSWKGLDKARRIKV